MIVLSLATGFLKHVWFDDLLLFRSLKNVWFDMFLLSLSLAFENMHYARFDLHLLLFRTRNFKKVWFDMFSRDF